MSTSSIKRTALSQSSSSAQITKVSKASDIKTKKFVSHTYTDFAMLDENVLLHLNSMNIDESTTKKRVRDDGDGKQDANSNLPTKKQKIENVALLTQITGEQNEKFNKLIATYGRGSKNKISVQQSFPYKLMRALNQENVEEVITWKSHGRAFIVNDKKKFVETVLNAVSEMTQFTSFTRQLNLWGFKRITRGKDAGCYYHELFLRGQPHLIIFMYRQEIKGTRTRLLCNPKDEPNFYDMPALKPVASHNDTASFVFNENTAFNHSSNHSMNALSSIVQQSLMDDCSFHDFVPYQLSINHPQCKIPLLSAAGRVFDAQSIFLDMRNQSYMALLNPKSNSLSLLHQKHLYYYTSMTSSFSPVLFHDSISRNHHQSRVFPF